MMLTLFPETLHSSYTRKSEINFHLIWIQQDILQDCHGHINATVKSKRAEKPSCSIQFLDAGWLLTTVEQQDHHLFITKLGSFTSSFSSSSEVSSSLVCCLGE